MSPQYPQGTERLQTREHQWAGCPRMYHLCDSHTCYSLWIFRAVYLCSRSATSRLNSGSSRRFSRWGSTRKKGQHAKPGVDAAFQPRHRLVRFAQYGINAGDLIVGVVRVAEGTRGIQRPTDTLECKVGLIAPGVQHALHADDQGLVRQLFQSRPPTVARPDPGLRS